jgi:hypothetical protein
MNDCCDIANPLIRDGVSQRQRQAPALPPGYVNVDDRTLADFLVFAFCLAQQVHYYEARESGTGNQASVNARNGDWRPLWVNSTPVWIALISKTPWRALSQTYKQQLDTQVSLLQRGANGEPLSELLCQNLRSILQTWAELLSHIRLWYEVLENYTPLRAIIRGLVQTNLAIVIDRMQGFDQAYQLTAQQPAIPADVYPTFAHRFGLKRHPDDNFYQRFADTFRISVGAPVPDATPLSGAVSQAQAELNEVFQVLLQNFRQIIQLAPHYQIHSLEARCNHQPHIAMYISFLEVLKPAQHDLNRLSQRHLDFFYRQVLQLPERPPEPDHAHLLFELAKFQSDVALHADIRFKAGKDATGMELFYKLDQPIVLDKAQVTSLKSILLDSAERNIPGGGIPTTLTGLYASPIANSLDGNGEDFPKDQAVKAWLPFGDDTRDRPDIGLAIADPIFLLHEGNRTVTFYLTLSDLSPEAANDTNSLKDWFQVHFSGEKEWLSASLSSVTLEGNQLTVKAELDAATDPVVPFHADLQDPALQLDTQLPVALLRLKSDQGSENKAAYHFFQSAKLTSLRLTVAVDEVRTLIFQNDLSVLDATKPFQPFGPMPKSGSTLYVGSQEVFQKALTHLTFHIEFETEPPDWQPHYAAYGVNPNPGVIEVKALRGNTWHPIPDPNPAEANRDVLKNLFNAETYTFSETELSNLTIDTPEATEPVNVWTHQTKNGFLRVRLMGDDFLHDKFAQVLSRQVLAQAMGSNADFFASAVIGAYYYVNGEFDDNGAYVNGEIKRATSTDLNQLGTNPVAISPNEPFTPVIQSFFLSYEAEATLNLTSQLTDQLTDQPTDQQPSRVYYVHPFDGLMPFEEETESYLFPNFTQEGELFIGVEQLQPLTTLNLLVQVAEETADTSLAAADVQWHYLVGNTWVPFEAYQVISDGTNQLIASGVIQLAIPADISNHGTTILDSSLHWLKASVPQRSGAIPRIIGVHAQAARVTFVDEGNDPNHLVTPLPPGAIAKLAVPLPEIKAVQQPYPSFEGRPSEQSQRYYTRVSEQLRHKGRAITIFDYERLVLEQFPDIYKVRCINHGQVVGDRLRELMPGVVTLAVIPNLAQRRTTNDLQPKVNINRLETIRTYLQRYCSPWVEIQVVNPKYEPIHVDFEVKFKPPYDGNFAYYSRELERAIVGFLSPWTVSEGADIHFGGKVYRSSILNFVEEHPTVDYVFNFKMNQGTEKDIREFVASTARSILVSVEPSTDTTSGTGHRIEEVSTCPTSPSLVTDQFGYPPLNQIQITASEP